LSSFLYSFVSSTVPPSAIAEFSKYHFLQNERTIIKCWGVDIPKNHGISSGNGIAGCIRGIGVRENLQETRINLGAHTMVSDQGNLPNKTNPASSANPISFLGYSYISIFPEIWYRFTCQLNTCQWIAVTH
jgi:hypothetical protein